MITAKDGMGWKRGEFRTYYANMKIRVGGASPMEIHPGDEFEYDGTMIKYAGTEMAQPHIRGAIKQGWATSNETEVGVRVAPHVPQREIADAKSVNRDLSRVQRTNSSMESDSLDEETVLHVDDRRPTSGQSVLGVPTNRAPARVMTASNSRKPGMRVDTDVMSEQEGVVVGRVRSPAKIVHNDVLSADTSSRIRQIEQTAVGNPEFFKSAQKQVIEREGVIIRTNVGAMDRNAPVEYGDESDGVIIGNVRQTAKVSTDGIEVRDTSNIRQEREKVQKSAPAPMRINTKINPKVRVARAIDPNFPEDWSFDGKLADRLAAVKKHGATAQFLEALYAAEGDQMRAKLAAAFPKQFAG